MVGVTKARSRWMFAVAAAAVVVALIAAVAAWSQLNGAPERVESGAIDAPDRVDITASIIRVDPSSGELLLRLLVTPRGSLTTEGGLSPRDDLEIQTSSAMKTDPFFPALERIGTVDVPVVLGGSGVTAYPFDRYATTLEFTAKLGGETVPVHLTLTNRDALFAASTDAYQGADAAIAELALTRSVGVLIFAVFMVIAMWALAVAVATGAWHVLSRRRGLVWPALGWMAATLFAIAGFRNAAPGSPPIGSFIDYLAFFWAEGVIAICVFAVVIGGARAERVAEATAAPTSVVPPGPAGGGPESSREQTVPSDLTAPKERPAPAEAAQARRER
ncbi:DUF4436 family protein [Microbacterium sp. NPDC016588]